ncbi:VOC family protein [Roseibium sp. MMSF_3412]|uniref:VOC family protein n=1 Tax=Roseibium sp. MMSF_3412 TaxID=3046712 RepID=UPI00273F71FC|nr:VOC family protein [Roseibium sp. MMSF_3412]
MLKLDHITVIAPTLSEGVAHVRTCLDLDVPFGTRHLYMGTHNHRLQLGKTVYLEIVALDPGGIMPPRARWFGLDDQKKVREYWDNGRRLRGWVASSKSFDMVNSGDRQIFGEEVALPFDAPEFAFTIPADGSLPLNGAAPSLIDHRDDPTSMSEIPDLGADLVSITLEHPEPDRVTALYERLSIDTPPVVVKGLELKYRAAIATPSGPKELT